MVLDSPIGVTPTLASEVCLDLNCDINGEETSRFTNNELSVSRKYVT